MFNLPSREDCQRIVQQSDVFYCTQTKINGFLVEIYNYRLASYNDFVQNSFEMRGITFVYDSKKNEWTRHILMNKFFNVNENEEWLESRLKTKKVIRVQDKLDGSIISFVKFPDGSVKAKSKMSFDSEQAIMAQKLYDENENIRIFIEDCYKEKVTPIFELVSPMNQIVLEYNKTELILLQVRDNESGEYLSEMELFSLSRRYNIVKSTSYDFDLNELLKDKETQENIEGWVVTFEDGQMAKIKTDWYNRRHGVISELRENQLIELILNEEIDDVLSMLSEESEKRRQVLEIQEIVDSIFNNLVVEFKELRRKYFNDYNEDRKSFAMKFKEKSLFGYVMKTLNTSFRDVEQIAEKQVKMYILNNTNTLTKAKEFLK